MRDVEALNMEPSRKNGWTPPPHVLQVVAWLVLVVFAVLHFTSLAPALHASWQPAAYAVPAVALVVHLIVHLASVTIDPCDNKVLEKKYPKVKFDRSEHKHVIEDCHCYICQVDVEVTSKHCGVCNKCVSNFDHHCKWLNNCIGGKNYRWFIATLVTAAVALGVVTGIALTEFITYFTDQTNRDILQPYRDLNSSLHYKAADFQILHRSVPHEAWLAMLAAYFILGLVAVALVTHLFGFHIYLIYHNLSTYDYIVAQRDKESREEVDSNTSRGLKKKNKVNPSANSNKNAGHTTLPPHDFQTILQDAEREHLSKGETPPPSASPIRSENNNNNSKLVTDNEKTEVKRLRKKKKKTTHSTSQSISTIDNPRLYQNKGYTISSVDIPSFSAVPQILPAPVMTPRGMGFTQEYHSDSADSLLEVPNDHSLSLTSTASATKKKVRKKKPRHTDHVDGALSEDELNTTTLFTVNENARFARDGSLQYTDFRALPLTPSTLRKSSKASSPDDDTPLSMPASRRQLRVPPLDLSNLRGSHESVSFAPYTASMRSTDTVVTTERLLPPLKEEKRSRLQTVIDTEL